jgi:hypothetical protein
VKLAFEADLHHRRNFFCEAREVANIAVRKITEFVRPTDRARLTDLLRAAGLG